MSQNAVAITSSQSTTLTKASKADTANISTNKSPVTANNISLKGISTKNGNLDKGDTYDEKCELNESEPLNGLFALLRSKNGGNPHTKEVIIITVSSTVANNPWQVIDPDWTSHWVTKNEPDQWIKFDFKTSRMVLSSYTLKTYNYVAGGNHMKTWVVEGSANDTDWLELDRRVNVNDLNGRYNVKNFKCKNSGAFRFIRIKQTGTTHCESNILALTNVEFFGILRD